MFNLEKNRLIGRDGGVCQTWGRTRWLLGEEGDGGLRWDQWGVGRSSEDQWAEALRRQILSSKERNFLVLSMHFKPQLLRAHSMLWAQWCTGDGTVMDLEKSSCLHRTPVKWGKICLKQNHPRNGCYSQSCLVCVWAALRLWVPCHRSFQEKCVRKGDSYTGKKAE